MFPIKIEASLFRLAMRFNRVNIIRLLGLGMLLIGSACKKEIENTIPPPELRIDSMRITAGAYDVLITDTVLTNFYSVTGIPNDASINWYLNVQSTAGLAQIEFKTEQLLNPALIKNGTDTLSLTGSPITGWNSTAYTGPFNDATNVNLQVVAEYTGQFSSLSLILVDQNGLMVSRSIQCAP
jgi:hypothetical protein